MRKKLGCFWLVIFMFCVSSLAIAKQDASSSFRGQDTSLTSAVVKIFVTSNEMDYYRPWQSKGSKASAGSGAIIDGKRILTNAHVVSDHTFIQVKKDSDPKKYTARVVAIGHDCDLALLEVEDPRFFDGVIPLEFGSLPKQKDSVTVIGYPDAGGWRGCDKCTDKSPRSSMPSDARQTCPTGRTDVCLVPTARRHIPATP